MKREGNKRDKGGLLMLWFSKGIKVGLKNNRENSHIEERSLNNLNYTNRCQKTQTESSTLEIIDIRSPIFTTNILVESYNATRTVPEMIDSNY